MSRRYHSGETALEAMCQGEYQRTNGPNQLSGKQCSVSTLRFRPWTILTEYCPGPLSAPGKTGGIIANRRGPVNRAVSALLLLIILGAGLAVGRPTDEKRYGPYSEAEIVDVLRKVFSDWQGDKTEKLVAIAEDGQVFPFQGTGPNAISVSLVDIIRTLAHKKISIWQVTDIFHNHNNPRDGFSATDQALFDMLRKAGIKAGFHIFYPENRRIRTLEPSAVATTRRTPQSRTRS